VDKKFLTIIDFVDNTSKHSLQTAASLLDLEGAVDFQGEDILLMKRSIDKLLEKRPYFDLHRLKVSSIDSLLREVDILQQEKQTKQAALYTWNNYGGAMRMYSSSNRYFTVDQSLTGQYVLSEYLALVKHLKPVAVFTSKSDAMRYADGLIKQTYMPASNDMPSEAQIALLRQLGADEKTILFLDKAGASRLISELKRRF
jgi:hypothetical protein